MYVQRDESGRIIGVFSVAQPNLAEEWVEGAKVERPPMTEEEMRQSEIEQDKKFLADTDYVVAKIGEASLLGQDTGPLLEQYKETLEAREKARARIRINEGRA